MVERNEEGIRYLRRNSSAPSLISIPNSPVKKGKNTSTKQTPPALTLNPKPAAAAAVVAVDGGGDGGGGTSNGDSDNDDAEIVFDNPMLMMLHEKKRAMS